MRLPRGLEMFSVNNIFNPVVFDTDCNTPWLFVCIILNCSPPYTQWGDKNWKLERLLLFSLVSTRIETSLLVISLKNCFLSAGLDKLFGHLYQSLSLKRLFTLRWNIDISSVFKSWDGNELLSLLSEFRGVLDPTLAQLSERNRESKKKIKDLRKGKEENWSGLSSERSKRFGEGLQTYKFRELQARCEIRKEKGGGQHGVSPNADCMFRGKYVNQHSVG